ncbi:MAG: carboxypeptidase-like regulatory domain-containing protein [Eubacteriales bacterium]|nr:carboxypeptidase-like regulatory domain-containing protein [Eubacteriales bacterium]
MIEHKTYHGLTASKAQNESSISEYFNTYLSMNPELGSLVFNVHQNSPVRGRIPVQNARITISKLLGDDFYLSKIIMTDENGETKPVRLPTVGRERSLIPGEVRVYSTYTASVEAPGYQRQDIFDVQIFDGITAVQNVTLQPDTGGAGGQSGPVEGMEG